MAPAPELGFGSEVGFGVLAAASAAPSAVCAEANAATALDALGPDEEGKPPEPLFPAVRCSLPTRGQSHFFLFRAACILVVHCSDVLWNAQYPGVASVLFSA